MSFRTSPLSWCGNLPRYRDYFLLLMGIAAEAGALARNDREFGFAHPKSLYHPNLKKASGKRKFASRAEGGSVRAEALAILVK